MMRGNDWAGQYFIIFKLAYYCSYRMSASLSLSLVKQTKLKSNGQVNEVCIVLVKFLTLNKHLLLINSHSLIWWSIKTKTNFFATKYSSDKKSNNFTT